MRGNLNARVSTLERRRRNEECRRCTSFHVTLYDEDEHGNWIFAGWAEGLQCTCGLEPVKSYASWMWEAL